MSMRRFQWDATDRIAVALFAAAILTIAISAFSLPGRCVEGILAAGLAGAFVEWIVPRLTGLALTILYIFAFKFAVYTYAAPDQHRWLVTAQIGSLLVVAYVLPLAVVFGRGLHQARAERERTTPGA